MYSGGTLFAVKIRTGQLNFAEDKRTEILYSRKTLPDSSQEHIALLSPSCSRPATHVCRKSDRYGDKTFVLRSRLPRAT